MSATHDGRTVMTIEGADLKRSGLGPAPDSAAVGPSITEGGGDLFAGGVRPLPGLAAVHTGVGSDRT